MNVWIENPFDNLPSEGFRPQRFWLMAQAFAEAGHRVTLWTSDFNHTTKKKRRISGLGPRGSGFYVVMVPTIPYRSNVSLRRMFSHWRYAAAWERMARGLAASRGWPDVVIASSPPLSAGAAARRLAARCGARLVIDVMDAWPETFERAAPRWALAPLRRLARRNYLAADLVTTVADAYIDLVRSYGRTAPVRRFYHGIADGEARAAGAAHGGVRLLYIGNLGRTYDLRTVVEAMALVPDATLAVAGKGEQEAMLRRAAAENPRISFLGYLGEEKMNALLADCDIGIVPMAPESCVGIPYKLADYARAGLAVVSSLGGESARLLARYGAGEPYRAGDAADLARAVSAVAAGLGARRAAARALADAEFSARAIYPAYVAEVERLCAAH